MQMNPSQNKKKSNFNTMYGEFIETDENRMQNVMQKQYLSC